MPGLLAHSPADIIRTLLIELGLGTASTIPVSTLWPVYATVEPSAPDNVITVYNTSDMAFGRTNPDSERQDHYGFQIRVRGSTNPIGFAKANAIAVAMDGDVNLVTVILSGIYYCIHSVTRRGGVMDIGRDVPKTGRHLFTINCTSYLREVP